MNLAASNPSQSMRITRIGLDSAFLGKVFNLEGCHFVVWRESTTNIAITAGLSIQFDADTGSPWPVTAGMRLRHIGFERFYATVSNAQPGEWVEIATVGRRNEAKRDLFDVIVPQAADIVQVGGGQGGIGQQCRSTYDYDCGREHPS